MEKYESLIEKLSKIIIPNQIGEIPHGDMPGDKVAIDESHVRKADLIFKELCFQIKTLAETTKREKIVITVCGGSGVGKSEIASLLTFYFNQNQIGAYTLSGDNYPHRMPVYNDAERLHVFRESALKGTIKDDALTAERLKKIQTYQVALNDADINHILEEPWYESYIKNGRKGLEGYLGTKNEIGFEEVEDILKQFINKKEKIWLKRMGRELTDLWYEEIDFSQINVLIIEWTHGNSDKYKGVDIPILLNSTPGETLAHRCLRNRDGGADSPFTRMVLEIEQEMLESQAGRAKIIVSKTGELLSFEKYLKVMREYHKAERG